MNHVTHDDDDDDDGDLEQVRSTLCGFMPADAVLVGHSFENDLHATKIIHRRVIDTAVLASHPMWPNRKLGLRVIVKKLFGRDIQCHGDAGHDSSEDAIASLELAQVRCYDGCLRWM